MYRIYHHVPQLEGCVLIACWGVPGRSYPDNGKRCLAAAVEMKAGLLTKDMKTSMGVTTGHVGNRFKGISSTVGNVKSSTGAAR